MVSNDLYGTFIHLCNYRILIILFSTSSPLPPTMHKTFFQFSFCPSFINYLHHFIRFISFFLPLNIRNYFKIISSKNFSVTPILSVIPASFVSQLASSLRFSITVIILSLTLFVYGVTIALSKKPQHAKNPRRLWIGLFVFQCVTTWAPTS